MARNPDAWLQFGYIPYPLWRRRTPALIKPFTDRIYHKIYPVAEDRDPPREAGRMARYLARFGLLGTDDQAAIRARLEQGGARIEYAPDPLKPVERVYPPDRPQVNFGGGGPVSLPAQWEPVESIIVNWPILYPPLWPMYAQMVEAIAPAAGVIVTIPADMWAQAAHLFLMERGKLPPNAPITFLNLPTDDVWVRDYGPIVGFNDSGVRVAVDAHYQRHKNLPQQRDDEMLIRWAAHTGTPVFPLGLKTEGGNLWSDGAGTLMMTEQIFRSNKQYTRQTIIDHLHTVLNFDRLIITPYMRLETTGHIDLLVKLVNANTLLISAPTTRTSAERLERTADIFKAETNARGERYTLIELPTPPLYINWLVYFIRRSYTNALTVNGRVLVPVYNLKTDEAALRIYADAMPDHTIIPIDCETGANGGGAVHCLTKDIPAPRG